MINNLKMKIFTILSSILLAIIITFSSIFFINYLIHRSTQTHIMAEFRELTPLNSKMPVYFKGFKIGKVTKIEPNENFQTTLMHITLFPEKINLPQNVYLHVKNYKKNLTYAELELPQEPSTKKLKGGNIIKGKTSVTFDSFMENGSFELIVVTLGEIMVNTNSAMKEIDGLMKDIRLSFKNNENFISVSTRNLSQATGHLTRTSLNISSTVDQKTLDKTMKNLEAATYNMKNITKNIDCATRNLSQTMEHVNGISENVDEITNSVNCTMKSRFGGLRLFFGKTDQNCKCKKQP